MGGKKLKEWGGLNLILKNVIFDNNWIYIFSVRNSLTKLLILIYFFFIKSLSLETRMTTYIKSN